MLPDGGHRGCPVSVTSVGVEPGGSGLPPAILLYSKEGKGTVLLSFITNGWWEGLQPDPE